MAFVSKKRESCIKRNIQTRGESHFRDDSVIRRPSLYLWTVVFSSPLWYNVRIAPNSAAVVVRGKLWPWSIKMFTAHAHAQGIVRTQPGGQETMSGSAAEHGRAYFEARVAPPRSDWFYDLGDITVSQ